MITIKNLTKSYGENKVYENFNLEIEEGKITCILGESGSGKTTLLNCMAHLLPFEGEIDSLKVSYIFQSPRLVPSLTVEGNLKLVGASEDDIKNMLERVGIPEKLKAYPKTLSGGQAQRVAIARAFLFESDIILMDEPFASLDLKLKDTIGSLFIDLQRSENRAALFVTHNVDEALTFSDRVIVLRGGKVIFDEKLKGNLPRQDYLEEKRREIIATIKN